MKRLLYILMVVLCLAAVSAAGKKDGGVSKKDHEAAEQEYKHALEMQKAGQLEEAIAAATRAALYEPSNVAYATFREVLKQQVINGFLDRGNSLAEAGDREGAAAQFKLGLAEDPHNTYLQQRLRDVLPEAKSEHERVAELLASVDDINLTPQPGKRTLHLSGDTRSVYTQLGKIFGITFQFDTNFITRRMQFDVDNVDFFFAAQLLGKMTKTFWSPLTAEDALVANDTQENRTAYERMSMRSFYVGGLSSPNDLNDIANVLRTILDIRFVIVEPGKNVISVRAPREKVAIASSLLDSLLDVRPEIMLEVNEYEIDSDNLRQYGLSLPTSFQVFNIPSEIRRVLGSDAQPVIDQLNKTGTIDPSKISPSALSNLAGSPLLLPFLFFGKGLSLTGFTVPSISGKLSQTKSYSSNTERAQLRAVDGESATFRVGSKFPVVSSNFNTVAISARGAISAGSVPQFTFVDLGLTLKVTPHYHADGDVKLDFEMEIQGLGAVSINSIPELTTRSFKGNITTVEGEPSVVMGLLTDSETKSTSGYPGIGQIPGLQAVLNTNDRDRAHTEIIVVVTPRVVRKPFHDKGASVFWNVN
jgi:general secretion pathway protein D